MKKVFEKHDIWFALFWIVLYLAAMVPLRSLGDDSPFMMIGLIALSALMFLFVTVNGLTEYYGLAGWAKNNKAMLWFIPLWIVASLNLWGGIRPEFPMPGQLFAVVSMAFVGFAEEMIFRGFLFKAMLKNGSVKTAVIVSSVTFGIGHIANLLTGHELGETAMQAAFAIAVGFIYTMAFYKGGSLLPCILSHSLTDVFSVFARDDASPVLNWIVHGIIFVAAVAYCLYLTRLETAENNRVGKEKA